MWKSTFHKFSLTIYCKHNIGIYAWVMFGKSSSRHLVSSNFKTDVSIDGRRDVDTYERIIFSKLAFLKFSLTKVIQITFVFMCESYVCHLFAEIGFWQTSKTDIGIDAWIIFWKCISEIDVLQLFKMSFGLMHGHILKTNVSQSVYLMNVERMIFGMSHNVKITCSEIEFNNIVKTRYWYLCMNKFGTCLFSEV